MSAESAVRPEHKMGSMPVGRLLLNMSLPMMLSMLVQALYNIVDSMFVSRVSEEALTAVSLAFPVQNLIIGIAVGTGVGVNALLSKSLGEGNRKAANQTAGNSLLLAGCSFVVFALFGTLFARPFFTMQTSNPAIVEDGVIYLVICSLGSISVFLQVAFEKLMQATGHTMYAMITQCVGAGVNIILDPIMIFGLLGFPAMGVAGAALATVIAQVCGAVFGFWICRKKLDDVQLSLQYLRPNRNIIKKIYAVGVPSIIMTSLGSVMTFGLNRILIAFTPTATAVYGVYYKLQSFVFMPIFGLNNGMVPIISYNYGARKPDRIRRTIRLSIIFAVSIMLVGLAVFWLFTSQLLGIFNASAAMLEIGIPALRIISLSFLLAGINIVTLSVCQSLGHGFMSLTVAVIRQLLLLLPSAWVLARVGGLGSVWWSYPFSEIFTTILSVFFLYRLFKLEIHPLEKAAEQTPAASGRKQSRA